MKNNEIDPNMISDNIKKLSEQFIKIREASWQKLNDSKIKDQIDDVDLLKTNYQRELKLILEKHFSNLFSTQQGCLMAKFIKLFSSGYLESNKLDIIIEGLTKNKEAYPIFLEIDNIIKDFRKHLFDFFVSYGVNYNKHSEIFSLKKTKNKLGDIIITTEIKRTITDYSKRPKTQGQANNFSITLNELDDQFELTLKK